MVSIYGIGGASASGKTSLAKFIQQYFGHNAVVISLDWFYKNLPEGTSGDSYDWDSPSAFDFEDLRRVLIKLKNGWSTTVPGHDYSTYRRIESAATIAPCAIIIVEGILALHDPLVNELYDEMIFIDCDGDTCLGRRVIRDVNDRKYAIELVVNRYFQYAKPAYQRYILPTKTSAGFIIPNDGALAFEDNHAVKNLISHIKKEMGG